jgi:hypothetical protein
MLKEGIAGTDAGFEIATGGGGSAGAGAGVTGFCGGGAGGALDGSEVGKLNAGRRGLGAAGGALSISMSPSPVITSSEGSCSG